VTGIHLTYHTSVRAERASAVLPLHVRIGVNAGEPLLAHDDLFGVTVNRAARACQAAAPELGRKERVA
jgi:adenylate cyclase